MIIKCLRRSVHNIPGGNTGFRLMILPETMNTPYLPRNISSRDPSEMQRHALYNFEDEKVLLYLSTSASSYSQYSKLAWHSWISGALASCDSTGVTARASWTCRFWHPSFCLLALAITSSLPFSSVLFVHQAM